MTLLMAVPVVVLFILTALVSRFILHDHPHRKVLVGSIGLVASMSMYSSPLVAVVGSFFILQMDTKGQSLYNYKTTLISH